MRDSAFRLYMETIRKKWLAYTVGIIAMLLTSLSEVFLPKFIQWSVDTLTQTNVKRDIPSIFTSGRQSHQILDQLIIGLLLTMAIGWLGRVGWRSILARQTHLAGHAIKTRLWSVMKDQPLTFTQNFTLGDLMNRATADWNKTRAIHGFTLALTFDLIFFCILSIVSMLLIDPALTLLCLCIIPFLPRRIIAISKEEYTSHQFAQEKLSLLADLIAQSLKSVRLQRATGSEDFWNRKLIAYSEVYAKSQFKVLVASWKIFVLGALPTIFAYAVLFSYGLMKVRSGDISIGGFVALQSYILLLQSPLFELGTVISEWQTGFSSYQRIEEIFKLERKVDLAVIDSKHQTQASSLDIYIKDLSHTYDSSSKTLDRINLSIRSGEKIGITGPIGSGKTTIANLISGLLEIKSGKIEIKGMDIRLYPRQHLVKEITVVSQRPYFFSGTVRHNLSPSGMVEEFAMRNVLHAVGLSQEIEELSDGIDSWIGEGGSNLSGGQKQRLALARALLKPASIFILDDCLSAVDNLTETLVLDRIKQHLADRTVIWISHRPTPLNQCERVFHMYQGELWENSSVNSLFVNEPYKTWETNRIEQLPTLRTS